MKKIKLLAMGLISAFYICTMVNCSGSDSSKTTDNKTNTQTSQSSSSSSDSKTEDKNSSSSNKTEDKSTNSNKTEDKNSSSSSKTEDKSANSKKTEDKVVNTKYINIVNRTGVEICQMYVSATQEKNWGEDILTVGTMPADTQVNVMVTIDGQTRYFDLMIIDAYGTSITWEKIDLFSVSGKVIIDDKDIYSLNEENRAVFRRRKIGFVFQSFNLIPVLSVEENIKMPVLLDHQKVDEEYFNDLIKTLELENRLNHLPSELSGGQQQRVAIARALVNKPAIILADEPTGNLDSENSKEIIEMLKLSIRKYNQTAIMITHDIAIAENTDRIIKIKDGKVIE